MTQQFKIETQSLSKSGATGKKLFHKIPQFLPGQPVDKIAFKLKNAIRVRDGHQALDNLEKNPLELLQDHISKKRQLMNKKVEEVELNWMNIGNTEKLVDYYMKKQ